MKGQGYEYCNCDFGCGCNFGGFPNSKDAGVSVASENANGILYDFDWSNA